MFSLKTKDVPPKRTSLIVFSLFMVNGALFGLFANQLTTASMAETNFVKNDSAVILVADQIEVGQIVAQDDKPVITTYVVKPGDTISTIASKFSISTNTLLWANDLTKKSVLKQGQKLTILPVSGLQYTVGKGDTLSGIAKKFDADLEEIIAFNDLEDNKSIRVGMKLIVPNAELPFEKPVAPVKTAKVVTKEAPKVVVQPVAENKPTTPDVATDVDASQKTVIEDEPVSKGYFTFPMPGSVLTQGAHGYNSIDLGAPVGTPVLAAASGKVIVAKPANYNGGYGKYIVIEHENGTQTLYAHLSSVLVVVDDQVTKGEKIALSGNTGRSTGPHLHFEVRGGVNPWVGIKKLTRF